MGELQSQHEAHKARLQRMGGAKPVVSAPVIPKLATKKKPLRPIDPVQFWPSMWMWDLVEFKEKGVPLIVEVIQATADYYHLSVSDIVSDRRTLNIALPRQVAMYLCRRLTLRSYTEIGRRIGNRHHTTVLHASRKIEWEKDGLSHISAAVTSIMRRFGHHA